MAEDNISRLRRELRESIRRIHETSVDALEAVRELQGLPGEPGAAQDRAVCGQTLVQLSSSLARIERDTRNPWAPNEQPRRGPAFRAAAGGRFLVIDGGKAGQGPPPSSPAA